MRVATCLGRNIHSTMCISIHATHAGGDWCRTENCKHYHISIHATHAGGDHGKSRTLQLFVFQSTPPMRVATGIWHYLTQNLQFQSTPPMRVATMIQYIKVNSIIFQSTPPMRVATRRSTDHGFQQRISIHATHAGGDYISGRGSCHRSHFNPRHPCGWRRFFHFFFQCFNNISIHATHAGGDAV